MVAAGDRLALPRTQNSHQTHYGYSARNADNAQVQDSEETCACNQHYKTKSKRIGMFGFWTSDNVKRYGIPCECRCGTQPSTAVSAST